MNEDGVNRDSILIVDDEKSICDILKQYLERKGYNVFLSNSGESAIDIIQSNTIDIVLTDIKMPGMSGVELLKWIKDYNSLLPVLVTTGFPTLDTAVEALKCGAYDYLTKPFHLEEIAEKVNRALSDRKLKEENLLFSKLVSLHEVTKILTSTHKVGELNRTFLNYSVEFTRADGGALMFYDNKSNLFVARASKEPFGPDFWNSHPFAIAGARKAADKRNPLIFDIHSKEYPEGVESLPEGIQSYVVMPLITSQRTLGVLNLVKRKDRVSFNEVDMEMLKVLCSQASVAIENARLYHNIRDNYLKTIRGFALAVEAKDRYTHGHSENVMKYSVLLARQIDLDKIKIEQIKYAGLLHDIGKIGVPEVILNKPGRLNEEEFEQIKKHPEIGARILEDVPFFKSLIPIVRHHHEFYNGAGYPSGLKGENIPLGARILSVADAFEAMTSDRPYRKCMPWEKAFSILKEEKGKQFQADLVDAFIEAVSKESGNR